MPWLSKHEKRDGLPIASLDENPKPGPEKKLSEVLSEYEKHFYDTVINAADHNAEEAKKVVEAARKFVSESRLGYAITRPLLEHIKYWPSWSKREDFSKYAAGPFRYIDGSQSDQKKSKPRSCPLPIIPPVTR